MASTESPENTPSRTKCEPNLAFVLIQSHFKSSFRYGRVAFKSLTAQEVQRRQMNIIALIDTRSELPGETIGTVISTHPTIADAFQKNSGSTSYIRTKIVTLKVQLGNGEHVKPHLHLA